jgi:acyl transferase domain-containing protein/acyl carrier protein
MNEDTARRLLAALNDATDRIEALEAARREPIAVVGMACRFPGGADDPAAFWSLLRRGVDAITQVSAARWDVDRYFSPDPDTPGTMYTREGGFIDAVDRFDSEFFEISPREAASMDPQQRLLLELTHHALEDAQLSREAVAGSATGVFVGVTNNDYERVLRRHGDETAIDAYFSSGNTLNAAAGRLAYTFGLRGPAMAVDTACSSSLVAVHLACQALRTGDCERAVVGGVNLILSPEGTIAISRARMVAPDGRCKTFDAAADGYVRGEGGGVLILRRLSDAQAADEHPRAVIRGSAVNQNGPSGGLTVPSGPAQQALIRAALADAGLAPGDIDYIEAHGTGTALGDPIEVAALAAVFGSEKTALDPLRIGSVKTNIGHLESAAGMAGLIKTMLAIEHGELPPHLHFETPSPLIPWDQIPLRVVTRPEPWDKTTRRAGVSAFGASGTNAHLVVEPPPGRAEGLPALATESTPGASGSAAPGRPRLVVVSAPDEEGLRHQAEALVGYLEQTDDHLDDVAFALTAGRTHHRQRAAVVAGSTGVAATRLRDLLAGGANQVWRGRVPAGDRPKLVALFTGQGAQYVHMGRTLYQDSAPFRSVVDRCDAVLRETGFALIETLLGDADAWTRTTAETQPALFSLEVALAEQYRVWGIVPDAVLGHSVGEYAAACVAGVFELEDGVKLIAARGRLMQEAPGDGAMAAVLAGDDEVNAVIAGVDQVVIAATNAPRHVVISGERAAVSGVVTELERRGLTAVPLNVAHAFHSTLMTPVVDRLRRVAGTVRFRLPRIPMVSNVTGDLVGEQVATPDYWCEQLLRPVLFACGVDTLRRAGYDTFLEIGPHPVLSDMARGDDAAWIGSLRRTQPESASLLESVAALYVRGVPVDWASLAGAVGQARARPPGYRFRRRRCWIGGEGRATAAAATAGLGPPDPGSLLGRPVNVPDAGKRRFQARLAPGDPPFLADHRVGGQVILPAAGFVTLALDAATAVLGPGPLVMTDLLFERPLVLSDQNPPAVHVVVEPVATGGHRFRIHGASGAGDHWWSHAGGSVSRADSGPAREPAPEPATAVTGTSPIAVDALYAACRERGVDLGPAFRVITDLRRVEAGVSQSRIELSARWPRGPGLLHTVLLDGAFQTVGAALAAPAERALVPFSIDRLQVYRPSATTVQVRARLRAEAAGGRGWTTDLTIWDDEGVVATVEGLELRPAAHPVATTAARVTTLPALPVYAIRWHTQERGPETPEPTSLEPDTAASETAAPERARMSTRLPAPCGTCVIVADRGGVGRLLAERLRSQGAGGGVGQIRATCIEASPLDGACDETSAAASIRDALQDAVRSPGAAHLVYLRALDVTAPVSADGAFLDTVVRPMTVGLTDLLATVDLGMPAAPATPAEPTGGAPRLWVATRGAQAVHSTPTLGGCTQAMLWGVCRTMALEQPTLRPVRVDLDPETGPRPIDAMAEAISRELLARWDEPTHGPPVDDEIAIRDGVRFVPRLLPHADAGPAASAPSFGGIRSERMYVVTGGLGGLGMLTAGWVVDQGGRHLALLSRRNPAEAGADDARRVAVWRAAGVEVLLRQCDVSDAGALAAVLAEARASAPIGGVFHAAGALADGLLTRQDWSRFRAALPGKMLGAAHLDSLTAADPLDCFVLYSSTASVLGSPAQGNYAAANAFLDALAWSRRGAGRPAISLNWGAWSGIGLAAGRGVTTRARAAGLGVLEPDEALRVLDRMLRAGAVQVTVSPVQWDVWASRLPGAGPPGLLRSLVGSGAVSAPPRAGVDAALVDRLRSASTAPDLVVDDADVGAYVGACLAEVLDLSVDRLEPDRALDTLGLDSLMAVELRNRFRGDLGAEVPLAAILSGDQIAALTDRLRTALGAPGSSATPRPTVVTDETPATAALARVDEMSDDEVEAMLAELDADQRPADEHGSADVTSGADEPTGGVS